MQGLGNRDFMGKAGREKADNTPGLKKLSAQEAETFRAGALEGEDPGPVAVLFTSCSGSVSVSARTGLWRERVSSRRWGKKQRRVRRNANLPHLAYKGAVSLRRLQEETGGVR